LVPNLNISGIPYDIADYKSANPVSPLGKLLAAVNAKMDAGQHVFMSNMNTGAPSYYILIGGTTKAILELNRLIAAGRKGQPVEGYSDEINAILVSLPNYKDAKGNPTVKEPLLPEVTGVTFAPHDPEILAPALAKHLEALKVLGIQIFKPLLPVTDNETGANMADLPEGTDFADALLSQQHIRSVFVPLIVQSLLNRGATRLFAFGPGGTLGQSFIPRAQQTVPVTTLPAPKDMASFTSRDPNDLNRIETDQALVLPTADVETTDAALQHVTELPNEFKSTLSLIRPIKTLLTPKAGRTYEISGNQVSIRDGNKETYKIVIGADRPIEGGSEKVILVSEMTSVGQKSAELPRFYTLRQLTGADVEVIDNNNTPEFRLATREAYAADWNFDIEGLKIDQNFDSKYSVTADKMLAYATRVQPKDIAKDADYGQYIDRFREGGLIAHPNYIIEVMWDGMMQPLFATDIDMTKVIDEAKQVKLGVALKAGDEVSIESRVVRVEDTSVGVAGRRVVVYAVAKNQKGEVVAEVVSSIISRMKVAVAANETKVIFDSGIHLPESLDYFGDRKIYQNEKHPIIAKGSVAIPKNAPELYTLDLNRIHVSDDAAALAGFSGRIMQGQNTFARANDAIVRQLTLGAGDRFVGVKNLRFLSAVFPGDTIDWSATHIKQAEGLHEYQIEITDQSGSPVITYTLYALEPKTLYVFTGQGSQYAEMDKDVLKDPARAAHVMASKKLLEEAGYQLVDPLKADEAIDLIEAMNRGAVTTNLTQPVYGAYSTAYWNQMETLGLIGRDAGVTGHSLGEWIALHAAGALSQNNLMSGVAERGATMQGFVDEKNPQGMLALGGIKASVAELKQVCEEVSDRTGANQEDGKPSIAEVSNLNSAGQIILAGHATALARVAKVLEERKMVMSTTDVPVQTAFHSSLMSPAAKDMLEHFRTKGNPFTVPTREIFLDTTGE
ncbi:MAG: hypothetical protein ACD_73C00016G0001, partial [uncultured bacterium]